MALPLSGYDRRQRVLLSVSHEHFDLTVKGPVGHQVVQDFQLHRDEAGKTLPANLSLSPGSYRVQVFDPDAGEDCLRLAPGEGGPAYPCFFEQTSYEFIVEKKGEAVRELSVDHQNRQVREAITPTGRHRRLLSGIVNFGNEVGFSRFRVMGDGRELLTFEIEVFPAKLDYRRDFQRLLQEVNAEVYNLAFNFLMKTTHPAALFRNETEPSGAEFYYIFRAVYHRFLKALELIRKNPHHQIVSENRVVRPEKVKKTGPRTVRWLASKPHLLQKKPGSVSAGPAIPTAGSVPSAACHYQNPAAKTLPLPGSSPGGSQLRPAAPERPTCPICLTRPTRPTCPTCLKRPTCPTSPTCPTPIPRRLLETRKVVTYDTYENRFLKWMLKGMQRLLSRFALHYNASGEASCDPRVLSQVQEMKKALNDFCRNTFLVDAGHMEQVDNYSLVIQMAPGYKDVYRYYLMLQKGLQVKSGLFDLSVKELSLLYEYWCYLAINRFLRHKYQLEQNNMVAIGRDGLTVTLSRGKESEVVFYNPRNNERFSVIYNRRFGGLPTLAQQPDNILKLEKQGSDITYHYILDAKYRINTDRQYVARYGQPGPPEDTINAMHRYRDAIISGTAEERNYHRNVFGAFVLFPHNDELKYAGRKGLTGEQPGKFYRSIEEIGIGALPFLPGQTRLVEEFLDNLIIESSPTAFERAVVTAGTGDYFAREQADSRANVLIGPLSRSEQLQVCLQGNMYYSYLSQVKSYLGQIEYVAMYQSKEKFRLPDEQGILYYGRVKDFRILKRADIKELPPGYGRGDEMAVKFFIEKWERKDPPVAAMGYGPSRPLTTTWALFREAGYYPELHLKPVEARLWRELRRLEECREVSFAGDTITAEDSFISMEFPGLVIRRYNAVPGRKANINAGINTNSGTDADTDVGIDYDTDIDNIDDKNLFLVEAGEIKKVFSFQSLRKKPGKTIREIISLWQVQNNMLTRISS